MKKQIVLLTAFIFAVSIVMVSCTPEVHTHEFEETWTSDEKGHWYAATCEHKEEIKDFAEHSYGWEWFILMYATEYSEGLKERYCNVCNYRDVEVIPKLEHIHSFSEEWTSDSTYHWHAAICEHGDVQGDIAEHSFGEWSMTVLPTEDTEGLQERYCTECGFKDEEKLEKLEHVHSFSEEWTSDLTYHWHECSCGEKQDKLEHSFGEYVSNNDATILEDGTKTRTCKVCDYAEKVSDNGTKIVYNVGDIILKDGKKISVGDVDSYLFDATKAIGVVALINIVDGVPKPKIIGLATSRGEWAPEETTGYTTDFTGIHVNRSGSKDFGYAFSGDLDGSDNWDYICMIDSEGTQNAETNYPIFYRANIYGTSLGLTDTGYETGWYIPSIAELYTVYKNKEIIQRSLSAAGGFTFERYYWSSSQSSKYDVYYCNFEKGIVGSQSKNYDDYVFVLHDLVIK